MSAPGVAVGTPRTGIGTPIVYRSPQNVRAPIPTSTVRSPAVRPQPVRPPTQGSLPPGTTVRPGPQPGTVIVQQPGRPPIVAKQKVPTSTSAPEKKKKSWTKRIIIIVVILLILVGVFLLLYFTVFSKTTTTPNGGGGSSGGGGGNSGVGTGTIPPPPSSAPFQDFTGSGGVCSLDTDCPIQFQRINGVLTEFTQFCVNPTDPTQPTANQQGLCMTNKSCIQNSDCYSIPGVSELSTCDLTGDDPSPCRFTAGCASGFCQRIRCQTSTDCGLNEACTINDPTGEAYGYCLPLGNVCTNGTLTGGAVQCWGGQFSCTADLDSNNAQGYCTECHVGDVNGCNISNNGLSGPGSVCGYFSEFTRVQGVTGDDPALCKMIDNFNYNICPAVGSINTITGGHIDNLQVCCGGGPSSMCGKTCLDDYQCDNGCPYCVGQPGTTTKVCSCIEIGPYQYGFDSGESTYSCRNGNGFTVDTGFNFTDNQMNPNIHVCTATSNKVSLYNYSTTSNGSSNCSNPDAPYSIVDTSSCSSDLEGSRCVMTPTGDRYCAEYNPVSNTYTRSSDYVCNIANLCTKRKLAAGENCYGNESLCDDGLVCSGVLGNTTLPRKICIPNGQS